MILKYIVPKELKEFYKGKKILYCKILQKQELKGADNIIVYKVEIINYNGLIDVMLNTELTKLNIIDKIKILFL